MFAGFSMRPSKTDAPAISSPRSLPGTASQSCSGFDATPLSSILREDLGVDSLLVAGTATEMCVFQTVTDALRLGFEAVVQADACATVDEENESLALAYLERVLGVEIRRG
jgi:nicotinamidase-related amidase